MTKNKPIIIYHSPCPDGWTSAWVAAMAFGGEENVELFPSAHGAPPPDVADREVYILDYSYSRGMLTKMSEDAQNLVVLDHHKTSMQELKGLHYAVFDMNRSGAGITWDYFNPGVAKPPLVQYVQDKDLWNWDLLDSQAFNALISLVPLNSFKDWTELHELLLHASTNQEFRSQLLAQGETILKYVNKSTKTIAAGAGWAYLLPRKWRLFPRMYELFMEPTYVPMVSCHGMLRSDVGDELLSLYMRAPYSVSFSETPSGYSYSLRSNDFKEDVSAVAKSFDGGGHRNASGFRSTKAVHIWKKKQKK